MLGSLCTEDKLIFYIQCAQPSSRAKTLNFSPRLHSLPYLVMGRSRISGKGAHMYKEVGGGGVHFADFISFF